MKEGDLVRDKENPDDRLVIKAVSTDEAREWFISDIGKTVAQVNPEYPDTDSVIHAKYIIGDGIESDSVYTFPESRLESI